MVKCTFSGGCEHHLPAIYQTNRIVSVPMGGNIELSATIDSLPENGQVNVQFCPTFFYHIQNQCAIVIPLQLVILQKH